MDVKIPKEEIVPIQDLKVDNNNPNIMSDADKKALRKGIEKYGFIVPIVTNEDLLVADGQQRLEVAKEMGLKEVKVVRLPLKEVDRRVLRQVLNKLRGSHDRKLDFEEFKKIKLDDGYDELRDLLPSENLPIIVDDYLRGSDKDNKEPETGNVCPKCGYKL